MATLRNLRDGETTIKIKFALCSRGPGPLPGMQGRGDKCAQPPPLLRKFHDNSLGQHANKILVETLLSSRRLLKSAMCIAAIWLQ